MEALRLCMQWYLSYSMFSVCVWFWWQLLLQWLLNDRKCNRSFVSKTTVRPMYSTAVTHKSLLLNSYIIRPCALKGKVQVMVMNRDEGFLWTVKNSEAHSAEQALRFPIYFTPLCNWTHPHDQIFNNGSSVSKISGIDPLLYTKWVF